MNENEMIEPETVTEGAPVGEETPPAGEAVGETDAPAEAPAPAPAEPPVEETLRAEIESLRASLAAAAAAAQRRETEIRCGHLLRERGIGEELTPLLVAPHETEVSEDTLRARVDALDRAVEAAAVRILREKTVSVRPGAGDPAPITGKMIRETPVAKLMQILT